MIAKHEEALSELLHADAARLFVGPLLSPQAAWVDHQRVEELRDLLTRAGYTPRLMAEED